jgi:predicted TIM-barrel fold metal-dependent hydrolase
MKAEIQADQDKQVAEIQAGTIQKIALIDKDTAEIRANKTRTLGKAAADALKLVENARAKGTQMKTQAFGDPTAFSLWELAEALNPNVRINIFHSGQGTLWTDLQKASMGELGGATLLNRK